MILKFPRRPFPLEFFFASSTSILFFFFRIQHSVIILVHTIFSVAPPPPPQTCLVYGQLSTSFQGVIFSMTFNPRHQLLCSVSDDRSIRVWRVDTGQSPSGGQDVGQLSWTSAQFVLVHVLYGHTARVWDARYLGNNLVSIGEDSTCCIWNAEGRVIQRLKGHRVRIWNMLYKMYKIIRFLF